MNNEKLIKKLGENKFTSFTITEDGTLVLTDEKGHETHSRAYIISSSVGKADLLNTKEASGTTIITDTPFAVLAEKKLFMYEREWLSFKKLKETKAHFVALVIHKEGMVFSYYCNYMRTPMTYHIKGLDHAQEMIVVTINLISLYDEDLSNKLETAMFGKEHEESCNEPKE